MSEYLIPFLVLIGTVFSWYGLGCGMLHLCRLPTITGFAFTTSLGIACFIFLGGILNLLFLAKPTALYFIQFSGLLFALYTFNRRKFIAAISIKTWDIIPLLILVTIIGYLFFTLLPTMIFNHGDDIRVYLVRPLRMLQTGSIAGNPFDFLGLDSLGSQAWLQAGFLLWLPINYITLFDPVICLLLSGLLINDLGKHFNVHGIYRSLAVLSLVIINPHSVNVSALFSGSLMILGLVYASYLSLNHKNLNRIILPAVFIAALITLKTTFMPIALVYSFFFLGLIYLKHNNNHSFLKTTGLFISLIIIITLPWLLVSIDAVPMFFQMITEKLMGNKLYDSLRRHPQGYEGIFSSVKMNYGNSMFDYSSIIIVITTACLLLISRIRQSTQNINLPAHYALLITCLTSIIIYFIYINGIHPAVGIRYSVPLLIPTLALIFLAVGLSSSHLAWKTKAANYIILYSAIGVFALFSQGFFIKTVQVYKKHNLLSFPSSQTELYSNFNHYALGSGSQKKIRALQSKTKENSTILTISTLPYQFDFSRNKILNLHNSIIEGRKFSLDQSTEKLRTYLKSYNIQYVYWEYMGFDIPTTQTLIKKLKSTRGGDADRTQLKLINALEKLANKSKIIVHETGIVIFDITQPSN